MRTLRGVGGVFGGDADYGEGLVDEGVGAVLHLAGGVAFGVDVGDLFEFECAFEGDGVVDAAAEEEEVVGGVEEAGELFALGGERAAAGGCGGRGLRKVAERCRRLWRCGRYRGPSTARYALRSG